MSISARRRSPWSASATCRATCSATACCARRPPGSSPPSIIATSSSIPIPIRNAAFAERKRLFDLPRSSWQDFDKALISKGGGVFPRAAKEIGLSAEAQKLFGVGERLTPQELIRAILKAPVDLLFFGGIGTYVRAADESDEAAGDRANDAVRIAGKDLRCKVIGEGANLGMTQRGRIEAALRGVRLNTDAIDNSAGVNTSDMEVNIKIALSIPVRDGRLTMDARNALLAGMTDEVASARAAQQLPADRLRCRCPQRRGMEDFGFLQRLMQTLEARGLLDRAVEYLADDMQLAERRRRSQAFTRPELAVLLAYAKLTLYDDLLESAGAGRSLSRPRARPLFSRKRSPRNFPTRSSITGCAAKSSPPSSPIR